LLLSFDLVIKPVIDFVDNCLVLNFQILTTYLDDLNIIQVSYQSLNSTKKKFKGKKINQLSFFQKPHKWCITSRLTSSSQPVI